MMQRNIHVGGVRSAEIRLIKNMCTKVGDIAFYTFRVDYALFDESGTLFGWSTFGARN